MTTAKRYALGLDFGTASVRALLVDVTTGDEVFEASASYPNGVIDEKLPDTEVTLPPEFALQDPGDWLAGARSVIGRVLQQISAEEIAGVGVDFTACTMLPTLEDGTPLRYLDRFSTEPHAWAKLWKHHAAQPEADRVVALATERGEPFLPYTSGVISSEWMLPKCMEILSHAPEVYDAAARIVDAGDWMVQQMTGVFVRNACAAGYKGHWTEEHGFPSEAFLTALDPRLASLRSKWLTEILAPGRRAGGVSLAFSRKTGLAIGTPVSAATIDAHSGVAGMGVSGEGTMSIIMGTSSCHMVLSKTLELFPGFAGVVKDGILPGYFGYESGQAAVGDVFQWFVDDFVKQGIDFATLSLEAAALPPGGSGLVALDWWNGNRSVLMNSRLSGVIVGLTLATRPEDVYRAIVEATAFGTRKILESYTDAGIRIDEVAVCGGLVKDPLVLRVYADVLGKPVKVAASSQAVAKGAAIFGALAAGKAGGGHDDVAAAIAAMTRPPTRTIEPDAAAKPAYDRLYRIFDKLHDHFGRADAELMIELRRLRDERG